MIFRFRWLEDSGSRQWPGIGRKTDRGKNMSFCTILNVFYVLFSFQWFKTYATSNNSLSLALRSFFKLIFSCNFIRLLNYFLVTTLHKFQHILHWFTGNKKKRKNMLVNVSIPIWKMIFRKFQRQPVPLIRHILLFIDFTSGLREIFWEKIKLIEIS